MQRRTLMRFVLRGVVLIVICLLIVLIFKTSQSKQETENRIQILQHCCFASLEGKQICIDEFDPILPIVIIYFHPECEHCQYEAREIGIHASEFANVNLLMVTPDNSIQRIKDFAAENHLWEIDNFELLLDKSNTFKRSFGTTTIPSVFIYKNKNLIKKYIGETKIEAILMVIEQQDNQ
ncbi:MAG: redoxin domain-containing protein [Bacteroidota bacterium]|nr:redoxin domain-containing protein [Bacteroidota bacterium]